MGKTIRVLIADDHVIVRSGIKLLLESEEGIEVVGEAQNGREAIEMSNSLKPDIVLMDIAMPEIDGLEAARQIKSELPDTEILVLTMHRSEEYFFEMLKAGASGYLLKGAETSDLIQGIRTVAGGEVFLYPIMAQKLVRDYLTRLSNEETTNKLLSKREKEIILLLADGFTSKEIAEKLVISPSTVHSHRTNIMRKLDLNSRHELIRYAREKGLIKS